MQEVGLDYTTTTTYCIPGTAVLYCILYFVLYNILFSVIGIASVNQTTRSYIPSEHLCSKSTVAANPLRGNSVLLP